MPEDERRKIARNRGTIDTRLIVLRAQRKLACSFPNQTRRLFLDEISRHLLDTLHQLIWHYTGSKKCADSLVKRLVKITVKLYVIIMCGEIKQQQEKSLVEFREVLRQAALVFIRSVTSPTADGLCDLERIQMAIRTAGTSAETIAGGRLSKKSLEKLADVVSFLSDGKFLEALMSKQPAYNELAQEIAQDLQDSIDRGIL
ncbi:hypothetical protein Aperf_G00000085103 [Anoplocephala perfoliata]